MSTDPDWNSITTGLADYFDPIDVDFRVQGKASTTGKIQVLAYIDARAVQERLDRVVGPQHWTFDWSPLSIDAKGDIQCAKGTITIHGVSKSDVGTASNFEGDKGAVSGAEKRAAVQWGIGRYLYALPASWIPDTKYVDDATLAKLRAKLPKPGVETARTAAYQEMPASVAEKAVEQPEEPKAHVTPSTTPAEQQRIVQSSWEALRERAEGLGISALDFARAKKTYTTVAKMAERLNLVEQKRREQPVLTAEQHLNRLKKKANELGYSNKQWEQTIEDCHGDIDVIAQSLEHAAQTDLRQVKKAGVQ